MVVLSLFDGMSSGRLALHRSGINVSRYYSSEIDKHAIDVSKSNWRDITYLGCISTWRSWEIDWSSIDLILAGSPCQGFSVSGKCIGFNDERSALYFDFEKILKYVRRLNPSVKFLLENVKMKKSNADFITSRLNVEPVLINSAILSAQHRERYYWCNWDITNPEESKITISDIIDQNEKFDEVLIEKRDRGEYNHKFVFLINPKTNGRRSYQQERVYDITGKFPALTASIGLRYNIGKWINGKVVRRRLTINEMERLQTLPDNYTKAVSVAQRSRMIGNGWTVDVIAHILKHITKGPEACKKV